MYKCTYAHLNVIHLNSTFQAFFFFLIFVLFWQRINKRNNFFVIFLILLYNLSFHFNIEIKINYCAYNQTRNGSNWKRYNTDFLQKATKENFTKYDSNI